MATVEAKKPADVDFYWPCIVVGCEIEAVEFAIENSCYLLKNREPHYHSYDGLEDLWAEKIYELCIAGRAPFCDKLKKIKIDFENHRIKVFTDQRTYIIRFDSVRVFDDVNVDGFSIEQDLVSYKVVDWFDCKGADISLENILTKDEFINKITFYLSKRIDGNKKYADIFCESSLTEEQLELFEYGETMARFKTEQTLQGHGLKNVSLKFWKREKYPIYKKRIK